MIQFLRFDSSSIEQSNFSVISGRDSAVFFLKRALYLLLFIYSTLFLAAAIPFVKTPFIPIYFIGGCATAVFILRFANHIVQYVKYRNGGITVTKEGLELRESGATVRIPAADISYLERNFIGNIMIRQKYAKNSFPLMLLAEDDREKFLSLFQDMAPRRSEERRVGKEC